MKKGSGRQKCSFPSSADKMLAFLPPQQQRNQQLQEKQKENKMVGTKPAAQETEALELYK